MKSTALLAVSGGPDSMFLLDKMRKEEKYDLQVLHVNYGIRDQAKEFEEVVTNYCQKNSVSLNIKYVSKEEWKSTPYKNEEAIARWIRYEFFLKMGKEYKTNTVYIAHHLDDWIETAIMMEDKSDKYLYYGIKPTSNFKNLVIRRPLINMKLFKVDCVNYLNKEGIKYSIDITNKNIIYTRNKIRENLIGTTKKVKLKIIKHYDKLNKSMLKFLTKVENLYIDWKKKEFSWLFWNKINQKYKEDLLYYFLTRDDEFITINRNKLKAIIDFLKSSAAKREYRLMENLALTIIDGSIIVLNKYENKK